MSVTLSDGRSYELRNGSQYAACSELRLRNALDPQPTPEYAYRMLGVLLRRLNPDWGWGTTPNPPKKTLTRFCLAYPFRSLFDVDDAVAQSLSLLKGQNRLWSSAHVDANDAFSLTDDPIDPLHECHGAIKVARQCGGHAEYTSSAMVSSNCSVSSLMQYRRR